LYGNSALMDCIGCEKCRLWGKLQVLGLGTALKILFSVDGQENSVSTFTSEFFFLPLFTLRFNDQDLIICT